MKKDKILPIILLLAIIGVIIYGIIKHNTQEKTENNLTDINEYTPEQEINEDQLRETIITLYYLDNSTGNLKSEGKLIDSNLLISNPYKTIIQYLLEGPKNETLSTIFPENTRIIDTTLQNNCVTLNFSEELLNYKDDTQKYNIINSILNSLTQLTEVNSIKIQINGETNEKLNEEYSRL